MNFLNEAALESAVNSGFLSREPYPWLNQQNMLKPESYQALQTALPSVEMFFKSFGIPRKYGQKSHDRYAFGGYDEKKMNIAPVWKEFIAELKGRRYREFIKDLFKVRRFSMRFHWHYATTGCSISPHTDGTAKLGSHIFYMNTPEDWDTQWGGQTLVLVDKNKRFPYQSNPDFGDFDETIASHAIGNSAFLFARTDHSWHGMHPLTCPEGKLRKVFIVVLDHWNWKEELKKRVFGDTGKEVY